MKIIPGNAHEWSDDELQRALQAHLAPPGDDAYWASLEQRIMGRVRTEATREWWSWFPGWVRLGVAAAAAAILFAGIASWQTRTTQQRIAVQELFDASNDVPVLSERDVPVHRERDQTLRYLLSR